MIRNVWKVGLGLTAGSALIIGAKKRKEIGDELSATGVFRFGRAAVTIGKIAVDYKLSLKDLDPESEEYNTEKSVVHTRSALKLRELCCANGGCFIKVGQHLGALEYLLPTEYTKVLKVLHSNAPKTPVETLYKVIKQDLGKEVDELFDSFEPEPLGAASLAQVHKATLKDGSVVAVKVQHPNVLAHSYVDMKTMEFLVHLVSKIFPEFQFLWLAEETKKNLPKELDFLHEGGNCERVARILVKFHNLKVPKIYWDYSTKRILTMEYCEGGKVDDREYMDKHGISVSQVTKELGQLYSEMIFVQGFVHCDPHPGNVLVNNTNKGLQLVLLDHGLYQTLTDNFRVNYCNMWMAILNADIDGIKYYSEKMDCGHVYGLFACMLTGRSWQAVTKGVEKLDFSDAEDDQIKMNAHKYLPQIADILNRVPREMLLLLKCNDLLRGIECSLETRANASSFITMSKSCAHSLAVEQWKKCDSWTCMFKVCINENWTLFKINFYEMVLWLRGYFFQRPIVAS